MGDNSAGAIAGDTSGCVIVGDGVGSSIVVVCICFVSHDSWTGLLEV